MIHDDTKAVVHHLPDCDFCKHPSGGLKKTPARFDFKTHGGPWAFGCEEHYLRHRFFDTLGTGKAQQLVLGSEVIPTQKDRRHLRSVD